MKTTTHANLDFENQTIRIRKSYLTSRVASYLWRGGEGTPKAIAADLGETVERVRRALQTVKNMEWVGREIAYGRTWNYFCKPQRSTL